MAGQDEKAVFSHVEDTRRVGKINLQLGKPQIQKLTFVQLEHLPS